MGDCRGVLTLKNCEGGECLVLHFWRGEREFKDTREFDLGNVIEFEITISNLTHNGPSHDIRGLSFFSLHSFDTDRGAGPRYQLQEEQGGR